VLNSHGDVVAVVQALNKERAGDVEENTGRNRGTAAVRKGIHNLSPNLMSRRTDGGRQSIQDPTHASATRGFTHQDLQVLQALASHISIALQSLDAQEDARTGLQDTITLLREQGITKQGKFSQNPIGFRERRPLHKA